MNKVILVGRLANDVDLRVTANGKQVAKFTVAVNRGYKNAEGKTEADFITCVGFEKTAEFLASWFQKGKWIGLEGRWQVTKFQKQDGTNGWANELIISQVEFVGDKGDDTTTPASKPARSFNKANDEGEQIAHIFDDPGF